MPERLRWAIIIAIVVVWVVNFAAGLMPFLDYEPHDSINGIFAIVAGYVVGTYPLRNTRGRRADDDG